MSYRLYFMHRYTGHIERFEEFDAADDGAALTAAQEHLNERPLELWCAGRKIQRFEPDMRIAAAGRRGPEPSVAHSR